MRPRPKQFTILEAMTHITQNMSLKAAIVATTFDVGFKNLQGNTIVAHNIGEIELNEPIVDTTLFLRQITMAMYPTQVYPEAWINSSKTTI